jgi:hypothetical protein
MFPMGLATASSVPTLRPSTHVVSDLVNQLLDHLEVAQKTRGGKPYLIRLIT